jgi:serine protease
VKRVGRPAPFIVNRAGGRTSTLRALCAGMLAVAAWVPGAAAGAAGVEALPGSSAGLIVKLRDAPAHRAARVLSADAAGAGEMAQTQAQTQAQADLQANRVRQALSAAGLRDARLRPVGRAAQLLDFGGPLSAADARAMADALRRQPGVEWVALNERERRLQVPNDPYFAASATSRGQWWLRAAGGSSANALPDRLRGVPGLQPAWLTTTGAATAVVAVLDTGITTHPELAGRVLPGYDFVSEPAIANDGDGRDADPSDPGDGLRQADKDANPALFAGCDVESSSWHGTAIAGIVAAGTDNGMGVAGINWNGRVLPVRVAGRCGADVADIVDGMRWAAGLSVAGAPRNTNPARIVNISFGGSAACNAAYQEAIDELRTLGVVVVAAAGNGHGSVKRPASCTGVVGVAALNRDGFKATYSNFGPAVVVATVGGDPAGEGLWGAALGDDGVLTVDNLGLQGPEGPTYSNHFGTSFSAPVVAGVLSLMLSANPGLSVAQLIDGVRRSARPHVVSAQMGTCSAQDPGRCACTTDTCGAGILDAQQALLYALNPAAYVAPARQAMVVDSRELSAAVALGPDLPPNEAAAVADSGGGGGAPGWAWLMLLAGALAALGWVRASGSQALRLRDSVPDRLGARHEAFAERR